MSQLLWIAFVALGYLVGSIPFAVLIARSRGVDIYKAGSGNAGATNVMRVLGRGPGALCFALDFLKGLLPTLGAGLAMGWVGRPSLDQTGAWMWLGVMAAPVLGHIYPVFARFKGGKGVATGFGAALGVWPQLGAPASGVFLVWLVCHRLSRNVGLSSSLAAALLPPLVGVGLIVGRPEGASLGESLTHGLPFLVVSSLLALLILWRHRTNLARTFGFSPSVLPPR